MIGYFLVYTGLYFLSHTIIVYGLWLPLQGFLFVARELIWVAIVAYYIRHYRDQTIRYVRHIGPLIAMVWLLIIWWVLTSVLQWIWLQSIIVWIKYALWMMMIFLSAGLIGYVNGYTSYIHIIPILVIGWLLIDSIRMFVPDILWYIWFWPVWDYALGSAPPMYYRTWPWWILRRSWLRAWPNNYAFLLVWRASVVRLSHRRKRQKIWFLLIWLGTLSRGYIVWVAVQFMQFLSKRWKIMCVIWLICWLWVLSTIKSESTYQHIIAFVSACEIVLQHPRWLGLGQSWPGIHWWGKLLPENFYLQLLIDMWRWSLPVFGIFWYKAYRMSNHTLHQRWRWFFGMCVVWLFLHVFEDSMTNYLFFVPFGIARWAQLAKNMTQEYHDIWS